MMTVDIEVSSVSLLAGGERKTDPQVILMLFVRSASHDVEMGSELVGRTPYLLVQHGISCSK